MLGELVEAVRRYADVQVGENPYTTPIPGLTVLRSDHEKQPGHVLFRPSLCLVIQGAKWAMFGERRCDYRAGEALVVSVELPLYGRVVEASPSEPFLGLVLELDSVVMREVLEGLEAPPQPGKGESVFVVPVDGALADSALRLVRLLETPKAIPVLSPGIMREIHYWLLSGPYGGEIVKIALGNGHEQRMMRAIHVLRNRFAEHVRIEELAGLAQMSASAFHRQFKALTAMTPLQYQKQLRLMEARRLMVADGANVETAAFQVGYESPSQFSREYARMFGAPPRRDVAGLRTAIA